MRREGECVCARSRGTGRERFAHRAEEAAHQPTRPAPPGRAGRSGRIPPGSATLRRVCLIRRRTHRCTPSHGLTAAASVCLVCYSLCFQFKKVFRDIRGTLLRGRALLEEEQRGEGKGWPAGDSDCQCEVRSASPPRERASNYPARAGSTELSLVLVP